MTKMWFKFGRFSLVLVILIAMMGVALAGACGGKKEETRVTVTIGHVTDQSGPASSAVKPMTYGLQDLAAYYNENDLIPGVYLKVIDYDTQYDPSKDMTGWEFVKSKGAEVVVSELPSTISALKATAARDKIPVFSYSSQQADVDPPGWVFNFITSYGACIETCLDWYLNTQWDYSQGKPKVGVVGWNDGSVLGYIDGVQKYAAAHPDKMVLGPMLTAPLGVMTWSSEVAQTLDCDIVVPPPTSVSTSTFMREFRAAGGTAKFIWSDSHSAFLGFLVSDLGWAALDGIPGADSYPWWNGQGSQVAALAKELLGTYRSGEAASIIAGGAGYLSVIANGDAMIQLIKATAERVGNENISGQTIYETATAGFSYTNPDGFKVSWNATKRVGGDNVIINRIDAAKKDFLPVSDWLPVVSL